MESITNDYSDNLWHISEVKTTADLEWIDFLFGDWEALVEFPQWCHVPNGLCVPGRITGSASLPAHINALN